MKRRDFIASASALTVTALAGSRISAQESTPAASGIQPDGSWTFTDDRGRVIELPEMPTRILAEPGTGIALFNLGIKPVALFGYPDVFTLPEELAELPFFDWSTYELDPEWMLEQQPDLIVAQAWTAGDPNDLAGIDETTIPGLTAVAPTACILAVVQSLDVTLSRFEELAGALGADLETPELIVAREAFTTASEAVRAAAAEKPGLKVMAVSATPDDIWWANPLSASDLVYFTNLGVNVLPPDDPETRMSGLWQQLSWEVIGNYAVDLFLNDDRAYALSLDDLLAHEVFALHPAAKAGQVSDWTIEYVPDYASVTAILEKLATDLRNSEVVM